MPLGRQEGTDRWPARLGPRTAIAMLALVLTGGLFLDVPRALLALCGLAIVAIVAFATESPGKALSRSLAAMPAEAGTERRLAAVLDAVPAPAILIDRRALIVHANAAAMLAFPGLKSGFPLAFTLRAPDVLDAVDAVLSGETAQPVQFLERVPLERAYQIAVLRLASTGDSTPARERALIFMRDTTHERRLEAMRVDFIANASHELRTPLASILGFIETLQGPAKGDALARERFLTIMNQQAKRMARLIDDLLSLSRIEMNLHIRPSEALNILDVVGHVIDTLSALARERGIELRLSAGDLTRAVVAGDRDELVRVFENLIENAMKYGGSGKRVDVSITLADGRGPHGEVAVAVRDYGPGIAEEHVPRLTERFYRADVEESRAQGGTGLGLAIVKHIVNRHRGRLTIASTLGEGATFTVLLALAESGFQEKKREISAN